MPRYIDADKLKEHKFAGAQFKHYSKILSDGREKTEAEIYAYKVGYNDAIDSIADFEPTADVRENVHAHWELGEVCSACGAKWQLTEFMSFCPNCGAQMDEGRGDV